MRNVLVLTAAALVGVSLLSSRSASSPVEGVSANGVEIPGDGLHFTKRFRGGERASVHIAGSQKTPGFVQITVRDEKGNIVGEDTSRDNPAPYMAAVIWYPPRDGDYRISIRNLDGRPSEYFMAIH